MLRLADKWVWDFWFAQDGADTHMFYLQADNTLEQEIYRHFNPSVGHAVSQDLVNWTILPDAIAPSSEPKRFDNYTTWTGSVIQHDGLWYMFYTGSTREERAYVQRIGLATSKDLITWEKYGTKPLIEADPTWYERLDLSKWHDEAWRDPCVFQHPETGKFHALITARVNHGDADGRAVIGHATSDDLLQWTVQPPLTEPGEFGQMEVPQLHKIGNLYYLLFCTSASHYSNKRKSRAGIELMTGTHYLVSENPLGPFRYLDETTFFAGDALGSLYSGKIVQASTGEWMFMGFWNVGPDGAFVGTISDPIPVHVEADGRLKLMRSS